MRTYVLYITKPTKTFRYFSVHPLAAPKWSFQFSIIEYPFHLNPSFPGPNPPSLSVLPAANKNPVTYANSQAHEGHSFRYPGVTYTAGKIYGVRFHEIPIAGKWFLRRVVQCSYHLIPLKIIHARSHCYHLSLLFQFYMTTFQHKKEIYTATQIRTQN